MSADQILAFVQSPPFIPFSVQLVGGREIVVRHSDYAVPSFGGAGIWLLHDTGHVEAIEGGLILSMKSLDPVDPHLLTG
jgi:hypothetical protein